MHAIKEEFKSFLTPTKIETGKSKEEDKKEDNFIFSCVRDKPTFPSIKMKIFKGIVLVGS